MKNKSLRQIVDCVLAPKQKDWYVREESNGYLSQYIDGRLLRKCLINRKKSSKRDLKDIIINLLRSSQKDDLPINDLFDILDEVRLRHIVFCYLYGCYIYNTENAIKNSLNRSISKVWPSKKNPKSRFLLSWLLICLFHDVGYAIEKNQDCKMNMGLVLDNYCLGNIWDLKCPIDTTLPPFPNNFPICYMNILPKYDQYRKISGIFKDKRPTYDHGIYGGIILHKALEKMPEKFGMPPKYYEYVVWVIMCHNMWFAQNVNAEYIYKLLGMDSLCVSRGGYQISAERHPLLWLLSVVDNIEFTKRKISVKWLNEITIDELSSDFLKVSVSEKAKKGRYIDKYVESLKGLNEWLIKTEVKWQEEK